MTSLQVIDTGEVVEQLTSVEAERITARIADKLDGIADNIEQVMPLIREALTRKAWIPLGYSGASAYVSERFAGAFQRLPTPMRRPIVAELSSAGMSTRAIAPVVGIDRTNVTRDLQVVQSAPPEPAPANVNTETGEIYDEPVKTVGMDGKQYSRPEPQKPRAEATTSQFTSAIADLNRVLDKFHRIASSSNFDRNKEQVAALHGNDLNRAIGELQNLANQLH